MPTRQKNGLYRTKIKIGVGPDGKPINKWISGKTKAELERERQRALEYYVNGVAPSADRLFGDYAAQWFHMRKEPHLSPSTRSSYRAALNKHLLPRFGDRNLRAIGYAELQEYINEFSGASDTTITQQLTIIRGVFRSAVAERIIAYDPTSALIPPPAAQCETRRALTDEETAALLPLMDSTREGMYLAVLYYLGLRPGEARGLMWGDFIWDDDLVKIERDIDYSAKGAVGDLKTSAAYRYVYIQPELRALLYPNRGLPNAFLFCGIHSGKPLTKSVAASIWLDLMQRARLVEPIEHPELAELEAQLQNKKTDPDKRQRIRNRLRYLKTDPRARYRPLITPYYLRHNFITLCWSAGIDPVTVTYMVGHEDYRTTANIYTHLNKNNIRNISDTLRSAFSDQKNKSCTKVAQRLTGSTQK